MNPDDNDAWDLATLAAQVLRRQSSPSGAVDAVWALYESAKDKLEEVRLRADLESPEAQAAWEKQEAERLASLTILTAACGRFKDQNGACAGYSQGGRRGSYSR
jgi:hypothetical protein